MRAEENLPEGAAVALVRALVLDVVHMRRLPERCTRPSLAVPAQLAKYKKKPNLNPKRSVRFFLKFGAEKKAGLNIPFGSSR